MLAFFTRRQVYATGHGDQMLTPLGDDGNTRHPGDPSHFAELLDCLPDVLAWVKDRQGRYLWVNRAFLIQYSLDHPGGH